MQLKMVRRVHGFEAVICLYITSFVLHMTGCVVPGAGAFEIAAHSELMKFKPTVKGRAQLGVQVRENV